MYANYLFEADIGEFSLLRKLWRIMVACLGAKELVVVLGYGEVRSDGASLPTSGM